MVVLRGGRVVKAWCVSVWLLGRVGGGWFMGARYSGGVVVGLYVFEEFGS